MTTSEVLKEQRETLPLNLTESSLMQLLARSIDSDANLAVIDDRVRQVVQTVKSLGKKGSITIKVDLEPKGDRMIAKLDTVCNVPREKLAATVYPDEQGRVYDREPGQMLLGETVIEMPEETPVEVPTEDDEVQEVGS